MLFHKKQCELITQKRGKIMTNTITMTNKDKLEKAISSSSFSVVSNSIAATSKALNGDAYGFDIAMFEVDKELKELFLDKKVKGLGFNLCNETASNNISLFNTYLVAIKALNNDIKKCRKIATYDYIKGCKAVAVNTLQASMKETFKAIEIIRVSIIKENFETCKKEFSNMFNIELSETSFDKMGYLIMTKTTSNELGVFSEKGFSILFMSLMVRAFALCGCSVENSCKLNLCSVIGKVREVSKEDYNSLVTYDKPMMGFTKTIIDAFDMKRYQGDNFKLETAQKAVGKKVNKYFVVTPENVSVYDIVKDIKLALKPKEKKAKKKKATTPKKTTPKKTPKKKATTKKTTTPKKTETSTKETNK